MHPILFQLGPLTIRTYGALVALAFLASLRLARTSARLRRIPEAALLDLVALLVFTGLLGARLFYVMLNGPYFLQHPLEALEIWKGGLVFYGGFIFAALAGVVFVRQFQLRLADVADCLAPAIALGQSVGRWGCFFAGCCYGRPTTVSWAVKYKDAASLAPLGVELHPVQIYESFGSLLIALFLWVHLSQNDETKGEVFWLYILLYGALRFATELLRGDDRGPTFGGLYPSQLLAIVAMLLSSSILIAKVASQHDAHA